MVLIINSFIANIHHTEQDGFLKNLERTMKIEIVNRFSGEVIFSHEADENSLAITLTKAVKDGANLDGANLTRANLARANLTRANLYGANLDGANLYGANLTRANLDGANLYGANLDGANLARANLYGANLDGANLTRANLTRANLYGANLTRANLDGAKIDGESIAIQPIMVSGLLWWVLVSDGYMRIGCQHHKHSEWAEFTEPQISEMATQALEFWKVWKTPLMAICEKHAAKAAATKAAKE